ncbi:hypothetical protein LPTSP4_35830 [Leptospira ryugenii]|uniref:Stress response kinase A n=1 Tax=Leptospira ryugenii TaxID=1917863 RepID=A0A2P2E583_9LEPT|nr:serine/threonine protein kinase [Leptospira ryugenii]GBF52045.1 hypothetical protein LPTSP4_35830 [Leptospira ryugenii]
MNQFHTLSPDLIFSSLESLGFSPTGRLVALNSVENRVYDFEIEGKERYVVKFYRPGRWKREAILEEHQFLYELSENDIPVLTPIRIENQSLFSKHDLVFAIWPLQKGRIVEEIKEDDLFRLGRLMGRLHTVGKSTNCIHRSKLRLDTYAKPALDFIANGSFIQNKQLKKRYIQAAESVFQMYESKLEELNVPFQRIHGDFHKGNLLLSDSGFSVLDFDDFMEGPIVQDFWMLLPFGGRREEYEREVFFSGYKEYCEINPRWLELIEPLRGIRYVHYAAWIAKRWEDPSFPSLFPHFGTEEYWIQETIDLETLEKGIPNQLTAETQTEKADTELSNKDFFWDWEN